MDSLFACEGIPRRKDLPVSSDRPFRGGFDEQFIIVARHPQTDSHTDRDETEYFVVSIDDGIVHGPTSVEYFPALRTSLGVPPQVQFSKRIEQLAGKDSNN
jgi:hypothetical protein